MKPASMLRYIKRAMDTSPKPSTQEVVAMHEKSMNDFLMGEDKCTSNLFACNMYRLGMFTAFNQMKEYLEDKEDREKALEVRSALGHLHRCGCKLRCYKEYHIGGLEIKVIIPFDLAKKDMEGILRALKGDI